MTAILAAGTDAWGIWHASHPAQIPWERYLDEVAMAGYGYVEPGLFGYLPIGQADARNALSARKLKVPGGTFFCDVSARSAFPQTAEDFSRTADWLSGIGADYLILLDSFSRDPETGERLKPQTMGPDQWAWFIEALHNLGRKAKEEFGLSLLFHPHCDATVEYEPDIAYLLNSTDTTFVNLCLDTGHHVYSGGDPVTFWREHHSRIPYIHLKSMNASMLARVRRDNLPWAEAVRRGVTEEPARGMVDFNALSHALRQSGYEGFAVVEQDMFPCDPAVSLPLARRTIAFLTGIGFVTNPKS
ncbi:MAG: 2-keto-myo-inositol dehydratase [Acidobacteria bacterium]|nr:2-keto-myo-inositol dehydratase [Acidobacteriota bacterium]|tara:strand:- start:220 stop:1122 length:903 start_codon:yes stop_codon:yes gene_type:complete